MRILLASDAWSPQVNGVVRTLSSVVAELEREGHEVRVVHPGLFRTLPCPTYPEIRLALAPGRRLAAIADEFRPEAVHISTEGPLGLAARRHCRSRRWAFTTSFHTRFPEYIHARFRVPTGVSYGALRWFHGRAERVLVPTRSVQKDLEQRGFTNTVLWTRGVDTDTFRPGIGLDLDLPRPIFLHVGRLAVEKNIEAFLALDLPGSKLVVGDGPQRAELERKYADARFVGAKHGEELARYYASGDVFVFPSRTDTFGLVVLEALASGVPVAAFPVMGPLDVIGDSPAGVLSEDLASAARRALDVPREVCRSYALGFSWARCAELFLEHLEPVAGVDAALTSERGPTRRRA